MVTAQMCHTGKGRSSYHIGFPAGTLPVLADIRQDVAATQTTLVYRKTLILL
jgi:hypothetical protein